MIFYINIGKHLKSQVTLYNSNRRKELSTSWNDVNIMLTGAGGGCTGDREEVVVVVMAEA